MIPSWRIRTKDAEREDLPDHRPVEVRETDACPRVAPTGHVARNDELESQCRDLGYGQHQDGSLDGQETEGQTELQGETRDHDLVTQDEVLVGDHDSVRQLGEEPEGDVRDDHPERHARIPTPGAGDVPLGDHLVQAEIEGDVDQGSHQGRESTEDEIESRAAADSLVEAVPLLEREVLREVPHRGHGDAHHEQRQEASRRHHRFPHTVAVHSETAHDIRPHDEGYERGIGVEDPVGPDELEQIGLPRRDSTPLTTRRSRPELSTTGGVSTPVKVGGSQPLTQTTCLSVCTTSTRSLWAAITPSMSL